MRWPLPAAILTVMAFHATWANDRLGDASLPDWELAIQACRDHGKPTWFGHKYAKDWEFCEQLGNRYTQFKSDIDDALMTNAKHVLKSVGTNHTKPDVSFAPNDVQNGIDWCHRSTPMAGGSTFEQTWRPRDDGMCHDWDKDNP